MSIRTISGNPDPTASAAIKHVEKERIVYHKAWDDKKGHVTKTQPLPKDKPEK